MQLDERLKQIEQLINNPVIRATAHPDILNHMDKTIDNIRKKIKDRGLDEATAGSLSNQNITSTDANEDSYVTGKNEFISQIDRNLEDVLTKLKKIDAQANTIKPENDQDPVKPLVNKGIESIKNILDKVENDIDADVQAANEAYLEQLNAPRKLD